MQIKGTSISFEMESLEGRCVVVPEKDRDEWIEGGIHEALKIFRRTGEYTAWPISSGDSLVLVQISPKRGGGACLDVTDCIRRRNAFCIPIET